MEDSYLARVVAQAPTAEVGGVTFTEPGRPRVARVAESGTIGRPSSGPKVTVMLLRDIVRRRCYEPSLPDPCVAFKDLTLAWMTEAGIEPTMEDVAHVESPEQAIVSSGGFVWIVLACMEPVACAALLRRPVGGGGDAAGGSGVAVAGVGNRGDAAGGDAAGGGVGNGGDENGGDAAAGGGDEALPPAWELALFTVRPDFRRKGLGKRLFEAALRQFSEAARDGQVLYVEVPSITNGSSGSSAEAFFRAMGFGEKPSAATLRHRALRMERRGRSGPARTWSAAAASPLSLATSPAAQGFSLPANPVPVECDGDGDGGAGTPRVAPASPSSAVAVAAASAPAGEGEASAGLPSDRATVNGAA
eukprot:TRINITY_DN9077_c0_g1_i2.p1 TRINITY_DN9077_c0_g1~~TRINITY_DN9077_c0_g1_i2.p1  ORF type:complete len:382 (-),score=73.22 TRINITY_DN9077_c0_g1_i2:37-1119(-)